MNKYLDVFVKSGAFFGIWMGLFYALPRGDYVEGVIGGAISGVLFGGAMALFTYLSDRQMKKKGIVSDSSSVNQSKSLTIAAPADAVEAVLVDAIMSVPKAKLTTTDSGRYQAKTGMSWKSFGEKLDVSLDSDNTSTTVTIQSRPSLKTTMVDYGKNLENVEAISSHIAKVFDGKVGLLD